MKLCQTCRTENQDTSQYCDQCGSKFVQTHEKPIESIEVPQRPVSSPGIRASSITSVGIPPLVEENGSRQESIPSEPEIGKAGVHAMLVIERGGAANTEFQLAGEESYIGRWDADNGIFPDVDLDAHDSDAKVSRRHARIIHRNSIYMIEDLGSTNGTFVNRGRRLLPGSPQVLNDGDEIIVGKTFLRFRIGPSSNLQP